MASRRRTPLVGFTGCLIAGLLVAFGQAAIALMLVASTILGLLIIFKRHQTAEGLWAAVAFTAPLQGIRIIPALALSDVLIVVALISILPDVNRRWRKVVPTGLIVAFGSIVFAGLLGTFFAPSAAGSLGILVKIVLAAPGSVIAMVLWAPGLRSARRFAWFWFSGAVASSVWALLTPSALYAGRALGLTTHPNHFGLVCVLGASLGLGLAATSTGRPRTIALAGSVVLVLGVGASGSRAALIALFIAISVIALLTRRSRLLIAPAIVGILGCMAVIAGIIHVPETSALSRLVGGGGAAASNAERAQVQQAALASINRRPLTGEGFERALAAHNIYLQTLVVGGPLALLGFLGVGVILTRAGMDGSRSLGRRGEGALLAGLTAGYFGYLCSGLFDNILWDRYLWTYISLLLLLASTARSPATPVPSSGDIIPQYRPTARL